MQTPGKLLKWIPLTSLACMAFTVQAQSAEPIRVGALLSVPCCR